MYRFTLFGPQALGDEKHMALWASLGATVHAYQDQDEALFAVCGFALAETLLPLPFLALQLGYSTAFCAGKSHFVGDMRPLAIQEQILSAFNTPQTQDFGKTAQIRLPEESRQHVPCESVTLLKRKDVRMAYLSAEQQAFLAGRLADVCRHYQLRMRLMRADAECVVDVAKLPRAEIRAIENIGVKGLEMIERCMADHGLELGRPYDVMLACEGAYLVFDQ